MWWNNFWQIISLVLYIMNVALVIFASISLILKKEDPVKTLSWVIVMILLPYIGIILYVFFGRNFRKEKMFIRKGSGDLKLRESLSKEMLSEFESKPDLIPTDIQKFSKFIYLNLKSSKSALRDINYREIYFSGKDALTEMYNSIEGAKEHIHLQSFILEEDSTGNKFKDLLIKKAKEGIEVRLMYDGLGGRNLSKNFISELKAAGVEILVFSPFRWLFPPLISNYRNHRKILVIDGNIGFLGGVNIADRYMDGGVFPEWRDTHIKIMGAAVHALQASFLLDRYFILNKNLKKRKKYYPDLDIEQKNNEYSDKKYYTQIISSGPDSDWSSIMQCYFTAITQAKDHINIITPYFIVSGAILNAIKIASLSGVKVSLMVPERSDTWLSHWGSMSYISELLRAGVKVYIFNNGFNHSKVLSIDKEFCIIGSANMDNRSFDQHFEITSILYDKEAAEIIEKQFKKDLNRCTLVHQSKWQQRPIKNKIFESIARLVSPLL